MSKDLSLVGLEDRPGKVYLVGLSRYFSDKEMEWYLDNLPKRWEQTFDHAEVIVVTAPVEGIGVAEITPEELREVLGEEEEETVVCEDCGFESRNPRGLETHREYYCREADDE